MRWIEAKVIYESDNLTLAEELISDIFYNFRLQGVVVEVPDLDPEEGWGEDALEKPQHYSVSGYIPDNEFAEDRRTSLQKALLSLEKNNQITCNVTYNIVDEEDWAHSWKDYFWPERISKSIVVKPSWREYQPENGDVIIEIDPGMAFGTGTHPTTNLCINMIEKYITGDCSFLDVGTGSGILMIAAAKLGAANVCGIDNDEVAVEIAEKNLLLNQISADKFKTICGNLADDIIDKYDVVVANILADVVIDLLDTVKHVLADNGILICSGIIEDRMQDVLQKMEIENFEVVESVIKESWVAIVVKLSPTP